MILAGTHIWTGRRNIKTLYDINLEELGGVFCAYSKDPIGNNWEINKHYVLKPELIILSKETHPEYYL